MGHSDKVRLWIWYSTWVHIHEKFVKDLLNALAVIRKTSSHHRNVRLYYANVIISC